MSGYALHPEALADIDEIWDYIAEHNIDAADRVVGDIFDASVPSPRLHTSGTDALT
jgi:plasmid stabilization system protein ParE